MDKNEDNVYNETTLTEDVAAAKKNMGLDGQAEQERASTVLGKFKNVSALAQAYEALEAEFTRRSQRVKELEKLLENSQTVGAGTKQSGAEKLRKTAADRKKKEELFDAFVQEVGQVKTRVDEPEQNVEPKDSQAPEDIFQQAAKEAKTELGLKAQDEEKSGTDLTEKKGEERALLTEDIYALANENESVRLKIIGEYLSSLEKTGAPLTFGNGGLLASPPLKAINIADAGNMALRYFIYEKMQNE